jgi:hypothetical protein
MSMMSHLTHRLVVLLAGLALAMPLAGHAQTLPYGDEAAATPDNEGDADTSARSPQSHRVRITPYIEAGLVATAELSPGNTTTTYGVLAAGVDASIRGRNNEGSASLRYERRIGWGNNSADGDAISGIARLSAAIVPHALMIEAGALAARSKVENNGAAVLGPLDRGSSVARVYSAYAGPSVSTRMGDVAVNGGYRIGYTKVESPGAVTAAPGQTPIDVFDDSIVHSANIHAGTRAGEALPIGIGAGAGYNREDISNLDQRIEDFHARGDVTLPLNSEIALVGGAGWEKVEVSSRDAVRDAGGLPVIGSDGRLVTDKLAPRVIAFDTSGLIWDAGIVWRPSRRTAFEAHVGRRYGSTTYYGSFGYAPSARSSLNISVYDNITGFGGQLNSALAGLPTQFEAARNPLTGDINGCVVAQAQGNCLSGALGSIRSSVFRSRGVMASYGVTLGRLQAGLGAGYDRRKFIGAPGTVLALANGVIDQNYWAAAYLNGTIDRSSRFSTNFYANWYQSGDALSGDVRSVGATAAYYRSLGGRLTATAALGIDGVNRELLQDIWSASALVGLRYSF